MNLIWKIYNKIAIDLILYIIFKAFTDMYLIYCCIKPQFITRLVPRVYALSIERPTSREKANDRFTS